MKSSSEGNYEVLKVWKQQERKGRYAAEIFLLGTDVIDHD
jgi:hypothetical protein